MTSWTYQQKTGALIDPEGNTVGHGYAGHGAGLNNPLAQAEADVGPIPAGQWQIDKWFDAYEDKGPVVAQLSPYGFEPFGRSGFLIHGDNQAMNFTASLGCIILARPLREQIRASGVTTLTVTA